MMKLIIASNNKHKIIEIKSILGDTFEEILSQKEAGFEGEAEENGATFAENSYIKAKEIADKFPGYATLADDSGLAVDALGGEPGVNSARYCGEHGNDGANNEKLLTVLKNEKNRKAKFVCAITLILPDGKVLTTEGETEGEIIHTLEGTGGFGYDPLFLSKDLAKTFGEASEEEKNSVSHRGRALRNLSMILKIQNLR
ncbi:MAG: RdgB/HAM1 family non-canonical purine NTP pyrophosphatase [Clostridia bacterium]|nr:RdgB/HAM1 family non-canonical purine NTP pyrophosphatase [Clostridia bacterium]